MIPIVVTVSRKGEYTVVAIKQMGILKEERVAGGVGRSRSSGDCCGRGPWWWWWFWTLPDLKIRKEEFGDLAQDMELGEDGGRHSGWGRWW